MRIIKLLLFFLIVNQVSFSQEKRIELKGIVLNPSSNKIANSHIVNLNTKKGVVSDFKGEFIIKAKVGDWIMVSNVQFKLRKIKVNNDNVKTKSVLAVLFPVIYQLDEVRIEKKMIGFLELDLVGESIDSINSAVKKLVEGIKDLRMYEIMSMPIGKDEHHLINPGLSDLHSGFQVAGGSVAIPDFYLLKKRALRKRLNFKIDFPTKLKSKLGESFFCKTLKIPKENYYHFLDYCSSRNIEELYENKKIFEIIEILLEESRSYLVFLNRYK